MNNQPKKKKKIPLRSCIVCREVKDKKELLRIVRTPSGEIKLDLTGKLSGRGAYVCGSEKCIKTLAKKKVLNRVFETEIPQEVYEEIEKEFDAKK